MQGDLRGRLEKPGLETNVRTITESLDRSYLEVVSFDIFEIYSPRVGPRI